jgi:hypothetical protein
LASGPQHLIDHQLGVDRWHAPDHRLDRAALDGAARELFGRIAPRLSDPAANINARRAILNRVAPILPNLPGLSSSGVDAEFVGGLPDRQGRE